MAARKEGLVLDPTYTGKVMAGFIERARTQGADKTIVFLHSGGTPGVFAYQNTILQAIGAGECRVLCGFTRNVLGFFFTLCRWKVG